MMINDGQLFDSCPVECGTDSEDGAAQLQLVSTFKLCSYVDTDTFRRVVNFGAAPGLVFCIISGDFDILIYDEDYFTAQIPIALNANGQKFKVTDT